jgi:pimeloyl-ACP methyl ester carboxylesterase
LRGDEPRARAHSKARDDVLARPGAVEAALGYYWSFPKDAFLPSGKRARDTLRATISAPTLTLAGRRDGSTDQGAFERTHQAFAGPYTLSWFEDPGHFLHRERFARARDQILVFLGPP